MSELYGAGVEHHTQTIIFELISSSSTSPQRDVVLNFLEKYRYRCLVSTQPMMDLSGDTAKNARSHNEQAVSVRIDGQMQ